MAKKRQNSASHRRRAGNHDRLGLSIAFGAVAGVVALGAVAGAIAANKNASDPTLDIAASLQTGSVLFVSPNGRPCRQKQIDNATWTISDSGSVDCEAAVSKITSSERQQWSSDRVEAIRSGLSGR